MEIATGAIQENEFIAKKYSCKGENISPPLSFANVPENTGSLALTITDIDSLEVITCHYLVWNIPPTRDELDEGEVPDESLIGLNSFDHNHYDGPCRDEDNEAHRYVIRLYALSDKLDISELTDWEDFENSVQGLIVEEAEQMFLY